MKTRFGVEIRGFEAGEIDLGLYAARAPALAASPQLALIVEAAYEATYANPDGDKFCALLFVGHADRVPAGSESERRAKEESAAQERALHARDWVLGAINALATANGEAPLAAWDSAEHVVSYWVGVGAGELAETPGTLAAGLQNRRVRIVAAGLNVAVIDRNNTAYFTISG